MRGRLLQLDPSIRAASWIVPTPLCRDQTIRELALHPSKSTWLAEPRVRCWADLWRWVASVVRRGPTLLSEPAATAVFDQALRDETSGGARGPLGPLTSHVGYRRRLRRRIRDWTTAERHRDRDDAPAPAEAEDDSIAAAEASVFRRYRKLLADLDAEDEAGMAVWASLRLRDRNARSSPGDGDHLVFLDFEGKSPAQWRILRDALERPRSVDVTLCHQDAPERAELYLATGPTRARLLELGMVESVVPSDPHRPTGLRAVDALLFGEPTPRIEASEGLSIRGGPAGLDLGRMVACEARELIARGVEPDEILVAFPRWDDQAATICEAMRRAGLPVHDASPKALDVDPAVAATLAAARIPAEEWEVERVAQFLRNGQLRPAWGGSPVEPMALAEVASTLHDLSVFRGRGEILRALGREIGRDEDAPDPVERDKRRRRVERARRADPILKGLIGEIGTLDLPRPWAEHAAELRRATRALGLGSRDGRGLDALWDALDDRAEAFDRLGRGRAEVAWEEFVEELTDIAAEACLPAPPAPAGSIRTALADDLAGCRASHVILAGLAEGTFPRRSAVQRFLELRPGESPDAAARAAYAAETLRFLRALGAAERGAHLFYPTTDAKGQPLLRAGFLDDLLGALSGPAEAACHVAHARFHPALLGRDDLAVAPADARVLAAAQAAEEGRVARLRELARDPSHRAPLEGAAAALRALEHRRRGTPFGPFEGLIADAEAHARLAQDFDGVVHVFSPSQLETYLGCPFQFFSRHVLHLEPVSERDELDEDSTERGSRLHDILEEFERRRVEADGEVPDDRLMAEAVDKVLAVELNQLSELDVGLREIELGQVRRLIAQYAHQREEYTSQAEAVPTPTRFEFAFGEPGTEHPEFELTLGAEVVRLKGRIDRIDLLDDGSSPPRFRIIDYKSGTPPAKRDVETGRMLQLPLYAMAVERLLYERGEAELMDVGYWGLKDKGYRPIVFEQWRELRESLVEQVFAIIRRLRGGAFEVAPRKEGCEAYCEYRAVCRVRQVRAADKAPADPAPAVSPEKTLGGRPARPARGAKGPKAAGAEAARP